MQTLRTSLLALALLALAPLTAAAQPPVVLTPDAPVYLLFDHDGSGPPTHFEVQWDQGEWVRVADFEAGTVTYRAAIPALTPGAHVVRARACSTAFNPICSAGAEPFAFTVTVTPGIPTNLRIGAGQ